MTNPTIFPARPLATLALTLAAVTALPGCAPLLFGGAVIGSAMVAIDRRTTGAQLEDQAIEFKVSERVAATGTFGHVNATSYNRMLLLTGEVPTETDRAKVEQAVQKIENLRSVVNELAVAGNSSLTARTNDTVLSGKVKATLVEAEDLKATAVKVVTERANVYLMGRVTEREAARAADLASRVGGVQRVVRVFELLTEEQLARIQPTQAKK